MKTKRYAPSTIVRIRYHKDELKTIKKKKGKLSLSAYIREKSLM